MPNSNPPEDALVELEPTSPNTITIANVNKDGDPTIARCNSEGVWYITVKDQEIELWELIQQMHKFLGVLEELRDDNNG